MRTDLYMDLENLIERAWNDRSLLQEKEISIAINTIIEDLDVGRRRIAEPINGEWKVNVLQRTPPDVSSYRSLYTIRSISNHIFESTNLPVPFSPPLSFQLLHFPLKFSWILLFYLMMMMMMYHLVIS